MTASAGRAADLRFVVTGGDRDLNLQVTKPDARGRPVDVIQVPLSAATPKTRRQLHEKLLAVRNEDPGLHADADPSAARPALEALRTRGFGLGYELCGFRRFQDLCEACAGELDLARRRTATALIDVEHPTGLSIPFELVPLFDATWPDSIESRDDVEIGAASFPGFAAVVRRVPRSNVPQGNYFDSPPLNVGFVRHYGLPAVEQEFRELKTDKELAIEEVFTAAGLTSADATRKLSYRLFHGCGENGAHPRDQILHFACHCDAPDTESEDWRLRICDDVPVYRNELVSELMLLWHTARSTPATPAKLVFMNGCNTASIEPEAAASFVGVFLDNESIGFIGTETNIPDDVAAEYASIFYRRLLRGSTIGEAAQEAKRELLIRYMNPLGVLYTLYGNPDLRLPPAKQAAVE